MKEAEWWVTVCKKYASWVILGASIASDKVFDILGSEEDRRAFGRIMRKLRKKHLAAGEPEEKFNPNPAFLTLHGKYEVIRCLVDAARQYNFPNYVIGHPQIQICVTNPECISGIHREKEGA